MLTVETIGRIRREHFIKGKTIKEIVRDLKVSRNTVRRVLRSGATSFEYEREVQPRPKLGRWTEELDAVLAGNAAKPAREQLTLIRIFEELRGRGYDGGYDAVRRYARRWAKQHGQATAAAYVPLSFAPGEAYQFDWSHEVVLLSGVTVIVKAAHVRLCHSRMLFVRAYPRETQEMVFDAHDRAFALFKGACGRGIYDNMKTAVEKIFVGKQRLYNRRFLQMCSHYLVDPIACTPASGWEKGQVENQVGLVRQRFFTPRLRFKNLDELNAWLLDKCIAYAKVHPHPELTEQTIWEVFEAERPKLVPYAGRFDGFHAVPASVSKTCLVRFDNNKYSVTASAVGRPVEVHAYADRIVIRGSYPDGDVTDMTLGLFSGFGEGNDRINLSTLHSAKGREFVVVVLFGMDDGRIPRRNTSSGDLREARTLFYVGFTRAPPRRTAYADNVIRSRTLYVDSLWVYHSAGTGRYLRPCN